MKNRTHLIGVMAAACSLWGCAVEGAPAASVEEAEGDEGEILAVVDFEGARLTFVDETMDEDVSVGILEEGAINLDTIYGQEATPLEIFRAVASPGREAPPRLIEHHFRVRQDPPRDLGSSSIIFTSASVIKEDLGEVSTTNCWGWGDVTSYNPLIGNSYHDSDNALQEFRAFSMITFPTKKQSYLDQTAELSDQYYETDWAHERALAICVTYAIFAPGEASECEWNTVNYGVKLRGENASGWWSTSTLYLTGYGQGLRYRSSSTEKRKYQLRVVDYSVKSILCKERYEVFTRERYFLPIISQG